MEYARTDKKMSSYNDFERKGLMDQFFAPKIKMEYDEYTVKKGDSLYHIAKNYGVTVADLTDVNMLTSNTIYPGQVLLVPKVLHGTVEFEDYLTVPNDTIVIIARKLGLTPEKIGLYNDFTNLVLEKNQLLKVPRRRVSYVIKEGESLTRILSTTGKTAEDLIKLNASEWLKSGNSIIVS